MRSFGPLDARFEGGIVSALPPRQKVVILTGDQHPAHHWKDTTLALMRNGIGSQVSGCVMIARAWLSDASHLHGIDLLVMNYCNWESPGWGAQARRLDQFVRRGGGLAVIHFANGAFHASLPGAKHRTGRVIRNWCDGFGIMMVQAVMIPMDV